MNSLFSCWRTLTCAILAISSLYSVEKVIFETDLSGNVGEIKGDCDDAGALAMIHTMQDNGECELLGVMVNSLNADSVLCADAINYYYGRTDIPIGIRYDHGPGYGYPQVIAQEFPYAMQSSDEAWKAVDLYRKILSEAEDESITIISVGNLTNLSRLLDSAPDQYSDLNGLDLVAKKVKLLSCMGGWYPQGAEYNFNNNRLATKNVADNWSSPIMYSGGEVGRKISTGSSLKYVPETNPVRRCYELYLGQVGRERYSWDQTSVLYAIRGAEDLWIPETIGRNIYNHHNNNNKWLFEQDRTGREEEGYLKPAVAWSVIEGRIESLMSQPPKYTSLTINFEISINERSVELNATNNAHLDIQSYMWDLGDGTRVNGSVVSHEYAANGSYTVTLILETSQGQITEEKIVSVEKAIEPTPLTGDNMADANINLALIESTALSSNLVGRGAPIHVCWDPVKDAYVVKTAYNECGVPYKKNMGKVTETDPLFWESRFETAKNINYISMGGAYANQPQNNTMWKVQYEQNGAWIDLEVGKGGWISGGIFTWGGENHEAIVAKAVRVIAYSDGINDVVSLNFRARGGVSKNNNDTAEERKAFLIQYLESQNVAPVLSVGKVVISGEVADADGDIVTVFVNGEAAILTGQAWSKEVQVQEGENYFEIEARDSDDNSTYQDVLIEWLPSINTSN